MEQTEARIQQTMALPFMLPKMGKTPGSVVCQYDRQRPRLNGCSVFLCPFRIE